MPNFDYLKNIQAAAREALIRLKNNHPNDEICAFGLYSDDGSQTICVAANTKSFLQQQITKHPEDSLYYKWMTPEWSLENIERDLFDDIQKHLSDDLSKLESEYEFKKFQDQFFEACVQALENLKKDGFFSNMIIMFMVMDYDNDENLSSWAHRLNGKKEAEEFDALLAE